MKAKWQASVADRPPTPPDSTTHQSGFLLSQLRNGVEPGRDSTTHTDNRSSTKAPRIPEPRRLHRRDKRGAEIRQVSMAAAYLPELQSKGRGSAAPVDACLREAVRSARSCRNFESTLVRPACHAQTPRRDGRAWRRRTRVQVPVSPLQQSRRRLSDSFPFRS